MAGWTVTRWRHWMPEAEVIIGGIGASPPNRAANRNLVAELAQTDILAFMDVDTCVDIRSLREAVELVRDPAVGMVKWFRAGWLSRPATERLLSTRPSERLRIAPGEAIVSLAHLWGLGFVMRREAFEAVGEWDERFIGWGEEDPALTCAVETLVGPVARLRHIAYHLWHPKAPEHSHKSPTFLANKVLCDRYKAALGDKDAMERIVHGQPRIDVLAGETQFFDHLYPIWQALPPENRGLICLAQSWAGSHPPEVLAAYAVRRGCPPEDLFLGARDGKGATAWLSGRRGPLVVASVSDGMVSERTGRPVVFCAHGAGQSYGGRFASYAGGFGGRGNVRLFICPNRTAAARNEETYHGIPSLSIGCPKLDVWHRKPPPKPRSKTVALSFHFDVPDVVPETLSAFPHYADCLADLATRFKLIGHGHPLAIPVLRPAYQAAGIEVVDDFEEVVKRARVYCCDNSSTLFEFASLGRPVVVLNAPWYRRDVALGLRFWAAADVGVQCEGSDELPAAIEAAFADPPEQKAKREAAVKLAYASTDGHAAERAAAAILQMLGSVPSRRRSAEERPKRVMAIR